MVLCVVFGCSKRSGRDKDVSFFRIPKVIYNKGDRTQQLSRRRRDGYLAAISRLGLTEKILKNDRVCSKHFVSGKPADLLEDTSPDWLPSLNLGHSKSRLLAKATERWERRKARQGVPVRQGVAERQEAAQTLFLSASIQADTVSCSSASKSLVINSMTNNPQEEQNETILTGDCVEPKNTEDVSTQTSTDLKIDSSIQTEDQNVQCCKQNPISNFFSENALQKDELVQFYTGLPNLKVLKAVFTLIVPVISADFNSKLGQFQEFIIVLMKLRLNCQVQDLAYRSGVAVSTVSRIFLKWITAMYHRLKPLILWPDRDALTKTVPTCFLDSFGKRVAVILDCFEVFLERPSNLYARACTWSSYKHHNTVKILLGITPQGTICYVSETWGGRVSDKFITEHCGILNKLTPGDVVLADRGFDISDSVGLMQATLHIPAFTKGKGQLSALEVHETRKIANVRIHVERVIGTVRQKYSILQSTLPIQYVNKRKGNCPTIDMIVHVCCALCNVCESVVPFD